MSNRLIIVITCIICILIVGCQSNTNNQINEQIFDQEDGSNETIIEETQELIENRKIINESLEEANVENIQEATLSCEDSSRCEYNEHCIQGECKEISTIYDTKSECQTKCNFNEIVVSTSDGEELTLPRGQGSYTSAGAIEWKLMSSQDYCKGQEETPVAIRLLKKNYGKVIQDQVIVVEVGQESDPITHPTINSINFRLTVESINEVCQ